MSDRTRGIFINATEVHDINTPEDWSIAEKKYMELKKNETHCHNIVRSCSRQFAVGSVVFFSDFNFAALHFSG
ncbi:MAG: hypothetical protein R2877_07890 [Bdellovibrionota bacterium]